MLPTNGWLPAAADDLRFSPPIIPLPPGSIAGKYRDFSDTDPTGVTQPILLGKVAFGQLNNALGVTGGDPETDPAALVTLEQRNVFGCVLVDRMTLLDRGKWVDPTVRPDSFFEPCDDMQKPGSEWDACAPDRPTSTWSQA